jgi:hypothetical protein
MFRAAAGPYHPRCRIRRAAERLLLLLKRNVRCDPLTRSVC